MCLSQQILIAPLTSKVYHLYFTDEATEALKWFSCLPKAQEIESKLHFRHGDRSLMVGCLDQKRDRIISCGWAPHCTPPLSIHPPPPPASGPGTGCHNHLPSTVQGETSPQHRVHCALQQHRFPIVWRNLQVDSELLLKPSICHPALIVTIVWPQQLFVPSNLSLSLPSPPFTPVMVLCTQDSRDWGWVGKRTGLGVTSHRASVSPSVKREDNSCPLHPYWRRKWGA
jgi:hypothetical protein